MPAMTTRGGALIRSLPCILVAGALSLQPGRALAQSDEQRSAARALATDGASAFNEGRFAEAVDLFNRAEALVHATPHLLYLARSYEKQGQLVRAREAYMKIVKEPLAENAAKIFLDTKTNAERELAAIEPRLSSLAIKLEGGEQARDAAVLVDGVPLAAVLIGVSRPIDPGEHRIEAGASGFRAEPQTLKLAEGEKKSITLKLIADPNAKSLVPSAEPAAAPAAASPAATRASPTVDSGPSAPPDDNSGLRTASYVAFGVGIVGLGAGTLFTLQSSSKRSDADAKFEECGGASGCTNNNPLSAEVAELDDDARSALTLGIIGFAVGGVGIAAGTGLLIASSGDEGKESAGVTPWVGLGSAGVRGRF
jgi:hypothetical protein